MAASASVEHLRGAILALAVAVLSTLGLLTLPAHAHPMPESRVWIDTTPEGLTLTLQLPLNRLEYAVGLPLAEAPRQVLPRHEDLLARYLLQHVGAPGWQALRPALTVQGDDGSAELEAVMTLRAGPGVDPRRLQLNVDAITHEVRTHRVQVLLRNDWTGGVAGQAPQWLGTLDAQRTQLPIVLGAPRSGGSVLGLIGGGMQHIAEGADHLLFVFLLLMVAPLAAQAGRWSHPRPVAQALRHTAWVVTAFTIGHSLTLALGSTGLLTAPSRPVEVAVASSIAVAALHALRPLGRSADLAMAGLFGLVHGLAFSASLSGAGLTVGQHAVALLAFNLGIEMMQLLIVAAALPVLLILAHRQYGTYNVLRMASALGAFGMALFWTVQRLGIADGG